MAFAFSNNKFHITVRRWRCSTHRVCLLLCIPGASRCAFVDAVCHPDICASAKQTCKWHKTVSFKPLRPPQPDFAVWSNVGFAIPDSRSQHPRFALCVVVPPPPLWRSYFFCLKAVHYAKSSFLNAHPSSQLSPPSITEATRYTHPPTPWLIFFLICHSL